MVGYTDLPERKHVVRLLRRIRGWRTSVEVARRLGCDLDGCNKMWSPRASDHVEAIMRNLKTDDLLVRRLVTKIEPYGLLDRCRFEYKLNRG